MSNSRSQIVIHVNQFAIKRNLLSGERNPPIIVRRKSSTFKPIYCHSADIRIGDTKIGSIVYQPDKPLNCGARVWLELDPRLVTVVPRVKEASVNGDAIECAGVGADCKRC